MATLALAALLVGATASVARAEDRDRPVTGGDSGELVLLTEAGPTVGNGETVWVALRWTAKGGPVKDVKITARGGGFEVGYPENTADHSAPWNGPNLFANEVDYTAFRIEAPEDVNSFQLVVKATYTSGGEQRSGRWSVKLPIRDYDGEDLSFDTDTVELVKGAGMVELRFTGMAPVLRKFKVMIPDAGESYLEYPQGDFASLERDDTLTVGETDVARFYLDASHLGRGEHTFEISVIYRRNNKQLAVPYRLTVAIV
jgi:hypothetical protein